MTSGFEEMFAAMTGQSNRVLLFNKKVSIGIAAHFMAASCRVLTQYRTIFKNCFLISHLDTNIMTHLWTILY